MGGSQDAATITLPRPGPDELVLAACDENGATVWVTAHKDTLTGVAPELLAGLLADARAELYHRREKAGDGHR